jgi:hypothetical protein
MAVNIDSAQVPRIALPSFDFRVARHQLLQPSSIGYFAISNTVFFDEAGAKLEVVSRRERPCNCDVFANVDLERTATPACDA